MAQRSMIGTGLMHAARRFEYVYPGQVPTVASQLAPFMFLWPAADIEQVAPLPVAVNTDATWPNLQLTLAPDELRWALRVTPGGESPNAQPIALAPVTTIPLPVPGEHQSITAKRPIDQDFTLHTSRGDSVRDREHAWNDVNRFALELANPEEARYFAAREDIELLVRHAAAATSTRFPLDWSTVLRINGGVPINMVPTVWESAAIQLEGDGAHGYRTTVRLPSGFVHQRVVYFTEVAGDEPSSHFPGSKVTTRTQLVSPWQYDSEIGGTFQRIASWNLLPAAEATLGPE